jgi:hypothetical protein
MGFWDMYSRRFYRAGDGLDKEVVAVFAHRWRSEAMVSVSFGRYIAGSSALSSLSVSFLHVRIGSRAAVDLKGFPRTDERA